MDWMPSPWLALGLVVLVSGCRHIAPVPEPEAVALVEELPGGTLPRTLRQRPALAVPLGSPVLLPRTQHPTIAAVAWQRHRPQRESVVPREVANRNSRPPASVRQPLCGHAPDYSWIAGCLLLDSRRQTWGVRYADPGAADRHGGFLELVDPGPMTGFRTGQKVRVEGYLVDPLPHQIRCGYRVRSLQVLHQ